MSNLLEQASLVLIPSGYKEGVVYSQIPLDGSGDLTWTRASNGTRVNSAGLVEVCPWNLAQNSETFNSSPWTISLSTISTNATTAPNGTTTAEKLVEDTNAGLHQVYQEIFASGSIVDQYYTFSCYAKASERNKITFILQTPNVSEATFDLINGTASITGGSGTAGVAIENVGNGWFRCSIYRLNTTAGYIYGNIVLNNGSGTSYTGNGTSGAFIWGAQLNIGSTAKPYFPTTDRLNVPRLTYQNGGGGCPSLLLEKQSTNLALYSEALSTSPNVLDASTATANVYVSPDGTQNAMQFTETTANDRHGFYQYTSVTAQTYTASIFTKQTGRRYIAFNSDMINGTNIASFFDLQTISVVSSGSGHTCSIQDFGNGWLRLIITFTVVSSGSRYAIWGGSPDGTTYTYAGSTSISQTFWGYQLEASSYPTSYIPTTTASATRVADECSKTSISSLIGQTEGVLFCDFVLLAYDSIEKWIAFLGSGGAYIGLYTTTSGQFFAEVANSTAQFQSLTFTFSVGQRYKLALAYKANDFAFYVNGTQVATGNSGTVPATSQLSLQYNTTAANLTSRTYNQLCLFPNRLTNAELASLTTI
jgi:hypothetical protein